MIHYYRLLLFFLCLIGSLTCYGKKAEVLSTTTIIHDIVQYIGGDHIHAFCLLPTGGDPHKYEPTSADVKKILKADIIFKNGLHLEGWLDKLIVQNNQQAQLIVVSEGIEPIYHSEIHPAPDPHVWMNPKYGLIFAQNICKSLQKSEPQHADEFAQNLRRFTQEINLLHAYIQKSISKIPASKRILITSHDAFHYYGMEYGIEVMSLLGTSTDADIFISDLNNVIAKIEKFHVPAVFVESTINPKIMEQLAVDHHVKVGGKLYADSMGDDSSSANTYIGMLKSNTDTYVEAMTATLSTSTTSAEGANENTLGIWAFAGVIVVFMLVFLGLYLKLKIKHPMIVDWKEYTIEVKNLSVSYQKKTVLANINFTLQSGKVYGLLGPNGAGKSTLFKAMLGLIKPEHGEILIHGRKVDELRSYISYIPQKEEIDWSFPARVYDVVLTGRIPHKNQFDLYHAKDHLHAMEAIRKMGLEDLTMRQIGDLSGGQQQRVFIARALCQEAEVLMFDEPFVGVDVISEEKIVQIIKELVKEHKTVIIIHHDLSKVQAYFDAVIMIHQRLIAFGKTQETFTQNNIEATYQGKSSLLQETDTYLWRG